MKTTSNSLFSILVLALLIGNTAFALDLPPAIGDSTASGSGITTIPDTAATASGTTATETVTTTPTPTLYDTATTPAATTPATPTAVTTKAFQDFSDVPTEHPYYNAIIVLRYQGIVTGYPDNTFKPDQQLNRVEALKLAFTAANIKLTNGIAPAQFTDTQAEAWYAGYLNKAVYLEMVRGYADGTFRPDQYVNTVEFLKMLLIAQQADLTKTELPQIPYADVMPGQWYSKYVNYAKVNNLLQPDAQNRIFPAQALTRGRAADIIYRFRNMKAKEAEGSSGSTPTTNADGTAVTPVKDYALFVSTSNKFAVQYPKIWFYSAFVAKPDASDIAVYGFGPKDLSTNPPVVTLELLPDDANFQTNLIYNNFSYYKEFTTDTVKLSAKINGSSRIFRITGAMEQEDILLNMLTSLTTNIEGLDSNNPAAASATTTTTTTTTAAAASPASTTTATTNAASTTDNTATPAN